MNQIKPYLFWIISGIVLVILLVLGLIWTPTGQVGGVAKDAVEIKQALDAEAANLKKLALRAHKGTPPGVFDPENPEDIGRLTNDYLLTPKWFDKIKPNVDEYSKQLRAVQGDLIERSKVLSQEVSSDHSKNPWYQAYQKQTAEFITGLRDAGCIVLPVVPMTASRSTGALPGVAGAPRPDDDPLNPEKGPKIREVVGLYTMGEQLPEVEEHPALTKRFRIVQAIGRVVLASGVETVPNPVVDAGAASSAPAAIAGVEWQVDTEGLDPPTGIYASYQRVTVRVQGSESSLMAALAGFESLDRPVCIVLSSTIARIDRVPAGSRKVTLSDGGFLAAPVQLTAELLVLDFSEMPDPTSAEVAGVKAPAGSVGPGGAASYPSGPFQQPTYPPMPDEPPGAGSMPPDMQGPPPTDEDN